MILMLIVTRDEPPAPLPPRRVPWPPIVALLLAAAFLFGGEAIAGWIGYGMVLVAMALLGVALNKAIPRYSGGLRDHRQ